jgi:glycerophosphoryl diester phosphodiesterase
MLIIAHRGALETEHENTIAALRKAMDHDADMIEMDIRLTKDKVPVLSHNLHLYGTQRRELAYLRRYTLSELQARTKDSEHPITTLDMALKECFGKIYLNLEVKEISAVKPTLVIIKKYAKKPKQWDSILFSSFKPLALLAIRNHIPHASLGMLHKKNAFNFMMWHRQLKLSAVGFYSSNVNKFALHTAKILGLFTYTYTVNRKKNALRLAEIGIDGIVTDYPSRLADVVRSR